MYGNFHTIKTQREGERKWTKNGQFLDDVRPFMAIEIDKVSLHSNDDKHTWKKSEFYAGFSLCIRCLAIFSIVTGQ